MKRRVLVIAAVLVLLLSSLAFAEKTSVETEASEDVVEIIDMSGFTDEEIEGLLKQLNAEIVERKIEKTARLEPGMYICGVDYPSGTYIITNLDDYGDVAVATHDEYESIKNGENVNPTVLQEMFFSAEGDTARFTASDGDVLYVECPCNLTISAGLKFE